MKDYKIANIPSTLNKDQSKEVVDLFKQGYDIYREYVFKDNAVIIFIKYEDISGQEADDIEERFREKHTM